MQHSFCELKQVSILAKKLKYKNPIQEISTKDITKIHHELRTPLVPIKAYANMLLKDHFGELSEQQKNKIKIMNENIQELENTIITLLDNIGESISNSQSYAKDVKQENDIQAKSHEKELQQENLLLQKTLNISEKKYSKLSRNYILLIVASLAIITISLSIYSLYITDMMIGQQFVIPNLEHMKSHYVVQNLRGDTVDTWLSWRLPAGTVLHINVLNSDQFPGKLNLIKEVILSDEIIEIDDSLLHKGPKGSTSPYYLGWTGALNAASQNPTDLYIPTTFEVISAPSGEGDITIELSNLKNGDGYSGYTKSIVDESKNQILKSEILIYNVDDLNDEQFKAIIRHELGHAFGLAHSTAPEDLMAPEITTEYPYISECVIDAISALYDGSKNSQIICEK